MKGLMITIISMLLIDSGVALSFAVPASMLVAFLIWKVPLPSVGVREEVGSNGLGFSRIH